jgi:hypothetical protein
MTSDIEKLQDEIRRLDGLYDELLSLINRRVKSSGGTGDTFNAKLIGIQVEDTESPRPETWSRTTDLRAADVWQTTRIAYNHAGDKKLYEFRRLFQYDSLGMLYNIGAEERIEIDAASGT